MIKFYKDWKKNDIKFTKYYIFSKETIINKEN